MREFSLHPRAALELLRISQRSTGITLQRDRRHMDDAQARATLAAMRQRKIDLRKVPFRHSTLSKWRAELVRLRIAGASYRELAEWLRTTKRRKYAATTVRRYLIQLPELQADIEGES